MVAFTFAKGASKPLPTSPKREEKSIRAYYKLPFLIYYIFSVLSISLIFCTVVMRVGTRGRRRTFSMKPIS